MPLPSNTGTMAGSTVSTTPAERSVRNSSPPPNSQISLPGLALSDRTLSAGLLLTMDTSGYLAGFSVREYTTTSRPALHHSHLAEAWS